MKDILYLFFIFMDKELETLEELYLNKPFTLLESIQFWNLVIPKLTKWEITSVNEEDYQFWVVFNINVDDDFYWVIKKNNFLKLKEKFLKNFFKNKILEEEISYHTDGRKTFLIEMKKFHKIKNELKVF